MRIAGGKVGIGDTTPDTALKVVGAICARTDGTNCNGSTAGTVYASAFVDDGTQLNVPDYVFEEGYNLMTIEELSTYIAKNGHLPNVPSRDEIKKKGVNFGKMLMNVLEKTEENTIYTIQNNENIKGVKSSILTLAEFEAETNEKLFEIEDQLEDQSDLNDALQAQIDELKAITNQELNLAQIGLNAEEIESLKMALGIGYIYEKDEDEDGNKVLASIDLGSTGLIGKFKAQETETGKLIISVSDDEEAKIGKAVIKKGENSITISKSKVKENSKIFITPRASISQALAVTEIEDGKFTVEVAEEVTEEDGLPFDWWIVEISE